MIAPGRVRRVTHVGGRSLLDAVAARHAPVGLSCAFVCCAGGIATDHCRRSPPHESHEVVLLASIDEPVVREGVPELVEVDPLDARLRGAALDHLPDPLATEGPGTAEPVVRPVGVGVAGAPAFVAAEGFGGPASEWARAHAVALAADEDNLLDVIDVGEAKPR